MPSSPQRVERELILLPELGTAISVTKGWNSPEARVIFGRARELCREVGDTPQLFPALFGLAANHLINGEYAVALEIAEELMRFAQRSADPIGVLQAYHLINQLQLFTGEPAVERQSQDELIARYDSKLHHSSAHLYSGDDPMVCTLSQGAMTLWLLGYPTQGLRAVQQAARLAQDLAHPIGVALALYARALLHCQRRESVSAADSVRAAIALCDEQGFSPMAQACMLVKSAVAPDRATADGIRMTRRAIAGCQTRATMSLYLGWLAEASLEGSNYREADAALGEAFAIVEGNRERLWEAELLRLRGELKSACQGDAEADFRRAVEVARSQRAKSLELRATTSLARLLCDKNRGDEARTVLAEIYNWFTEGFDTADLKDAKSLLDELSN